MTKLEKILLALLPAIAPVATGYIVLIAFWKHGWWPPVAFIVALALEFLGYFSARLIMSISEHNRTLSAVEKNLTIAPWRSWLPVGAYVIIALYLTFFVELFPAAFVGSMLAFPFIGLLSAWVTAEYRVLDDHAGQKIKAREDAKRAREQAKADKQALAQVAAPTPQSVQALAQVAPPAFTDENMLAQYVLDPIATDAKLAGVFRKSHTAIRDRRIRMTAAGIIQKRGKEIRATNKFVVVEQAAHE